MTLIEIILALESHRNRLIELADKREFGDVPTLAELEKVCIDADDILLALQAWSTVEPPPTSPEEWKPLAFEGEAAP